MRRRVGFGIGCGIALAVAVAGLVVAGPTLFFAAIFMIGAQPRIYQRLPSPDGKSTAILGRPGGSMLPNSYWVKIDRGWFGSAECTLANLDGLRIPNFTRMRWTSPDTVTIYYGTAPGLIRPGVSRGKDACTTPHVEFVHSPTLDLIAAKENVGTEPAPYDNAAEMDDMNQADRK